MAQQSRIFSEKESFELLKAAIYSSDTTAVRNLVNEGIKIDSEFWKTCRTPVGEILPASTTDYFYCSPLICIFDRMYSESHDNVKLLEIITILIKAGANVNAADTMALPVMNHALSSKKANSDTLKLLVEYGAEINHKITSEIFKSETLLECAIVRDDVEGVKFLIENGADVNVIKDDGNPLLLRVIRTCEPEILELFLRNGANLNLLTKDSDTLLNKTIQTTEGKKIDLLIKYNIDVNSRNPYGRGALRTLLSLYHTFDDKKYAFDLINRLIDMGVSVNYSPDFSPLMQAVIIFDSSLVELLLKRGASPNFKMQLEGEAKANFGAYNGKTVLHIATSDELKLDSYRNSLTKSGVNVKDRSLEIINLLLKYGANPNVTDNEGKYPCDFATDERIKTLLSPNKSMTEANAREDMEINLN